MKVFDFIKAINAGRNLEEEEDIDWKEYNPYLTNRSLSLHIDTVLIANQANLMELSPKQHFQFCITTVKPRKRFAKWPKPKRGEDIELIQKVYDVNLKHAQVIAKILTPEQITVLRERHLTGD